MILEQYFLAVMKICRNYFIALAIADLRLSLGYDMSSLSRLFNRNNCIVAKRYVVRSWQCYR